MNIKINDIIKYKNLIGNQNYGVVIKIFKVLDSSNGKEKDTNIYRVTDFSSNSIIGLDVEENKIEGVYREVKHLV